MSKPERAVPIATRTSSSQWFGDKQNGIEFRPFAPGGEELDEVLIYVDGRCVFHLEAMSDHHYWMGCYANGWVAHAHIGSKNGRSHVGCNGEGWEDDDDTNRDA